MIAPQYPQGGVWAVSGLLAVGLAGLLGIRFRSENIHASSKDNP
jgi:hypothetical protein